MTELKLPSLGEGIEKGTVISIMVKPGDTIAKEQPVIEVETDKVVVEVPADAAGEVSDVLINVGDEITEGTSFLQLSGASDADEAVLEDTVPVETPMADTLVVEPVVETKIEKKVEHATKTRVALTLPSLGEGIEKGTIIAIHVTEGETIAQEQTLMEIETDKVVVEVPADASGLIKQILVTVGDEISEGMPIIEIESNETAVQEPPVSKEIIPTPATFEKGVTKKESAPAPGVVPTSQPETIKKGTFRASPLARKLAREIGIDITAVGASSANGRISVKDVKAHSKQLNANGTKVEFSTRVALPDFAKWGPINRQALTGIDQATSKNMTTAWSQIPHAWLQEKVDITDLEAKRQAHKHQVKVAGGALTITSILVKIVAKALEEFPVFNTSVDVETNEVIYKEYIHIGVAVDSDRGLLVPVLRNANKKGLLEISKNLADLSQKVKAKKIKPEELEGGTFTISNLGGIGTSAIFPLVNPPQVAILGVAASQTEAIWSNGQFLPRSIMPLTIGFDHRIINGADAARFLQHTKQLLEDWFLWGM